MSFGMGTPFNKEILKSKKIDLKTLTTMIILFFSYNNSLER